MTTNIVVAAFGASRIVRTRALYQWDYGQVLQFAGLDLPGAYTVHFSDSGVGGTAKTMIGDENGVTIPDEYLTTGKTVYAWVYLHTGADDGETVYSVIIPVVARPQPTEEEPTPVQQGVIDQAIAALNSAVEQTAADVETTGDNATAAQTAQEAAETAQGQAESYAGDAAQSAADASGHATSAGTYAGQAAQSAQDAAGSATSAAGSAEAAEDASQAVQDMGVAAESLAPGSEATVSKSVDQSTGAVTLTFGIPQGAQGERGLTGPTGPQGERGVQGERGPQGERGLTGATGSAGENGVSPAVSVAQITGGHRVTITDADGSRVFDVMDGAAGQNGAPGQDGVSPTATVTQTSTGATISITDKTGTTTAQITNGQDGAQGSPGTPGTPGVSPTVTVTDITGGHRVTITDATGAHTFDVMDGEGGGTAENGLPTGGTTGQVLKKTGSADYAAGWSGMALNDLSNVNINLPYQGCVLTFNDNKWGAGLAIMSQCGFIDEDIDYDTGDPTGAYAIFNASCLDPMHTQYVRDANGYVMTHNQHEVYWTSNFDDYTSDSSIYLIDRASGTPFNRNIMRFAYNPNTGTYAEAPLALTNEVTGMWTGTQAQYDAIATKDAHKIYFIQE